MDVGVQLHDLLPLDVGEHHEGVHRPLDVVWGVLFGLKNGILSIIIGQEDANIENIRNNYLSWLGAHSHHKKLNTCWVIFKCCTEFS